MGFFDRYWEMREGGPYDKPGESNEIFKCKDCGAETHHHEGFNGEPETGHCAESCSSRESDWRPGRVSTQYVKHLEQVLWEDETRYANKNKDMLPASAAQKRFVSNFDSIFPDAPGMGV